MEIGARVYDRDDPDPNDAIVLRVLDIPISEREMDDGRTVADANSDYPSDDTAVVVVFEDALDRIDAEWDVSTQESLQHLGADSIISTYAYPESRLSVQDPAEDVLHVRRTEDGDKYIDRLRVTAIEDEFVHGTDLDGVDNGNGVTRSVCFDTPDVDLAEGSHISLVYEAEEDIGDDLPPLLTGVKDIEITQEDPSTDELLLEL